MTHNNNKEDKSNAQRSASSNPDSFLLESLSCFNQNIVRFKQGYRYTEELKLYCAYNRMLSGKLAYETLKANTQHALPSERAVSRHIAQVQSTAVEGVLRADELLQYLTDLKLPKFVALSEDATRITNRPQYDPQTNQIVGFVLPLGKNGMPCAKSYMAKSAAEIEQCFYNTDTRKEKTLASSVNVVMAQPLVAGIPAFCLLVFGSNAKYTTKNIQERWQFIADELKKRDIKVVTFASDSDPKFNAVMKYHVNLGRSGTNGFPDWFNANLCFSINFAPIQDFIHIGTKLRNRILNYVLRMGDYDVSMAHLLILLDTFTKEQHGLCSNTTNPKDRQNFESVLRICDAKVIDLLSHVEGSEGTVLYLRVMDSILRSFLDISLTPIERIRHIWFAVFILRIWKQFILKSKKKYSTDIHFISSNCYACVELNAHSIVFLMLYLRENNLDHLFRPDMLGSQPCESIFRQLRSLTSTYSTVTNFSVLEIIRRMSKIELQNEISHIKLKHWNFPRIGLPSSSHYDTVDRNGVNQYEKCIKLPCQEEIIKEIELAKLEAMEYAKTIGMAVENINYKCKLPKEKKKKETNVDISKTENTVTVQNKDVLQMFKDVNLKQYAVKIDPETIDESSPYVKIQNKNGEIICIEKHKLCWFLGQTKGKLSSDRLLRVMAKTS